jgi:DNA polymerase-3 subunit alpha
MDNRQFAHLHLHTDASLRDGLGTVSRMIGKAKKMGFQQIAITDHGTLANAVTFSMEAHNQGLKPLIGLEGYVEFDGVVGHITLLADGMKGWNSLLSLNNDAHKSAYKQPAFSIDSLLKHADGLVCLTGCIASPFHQLPLKEAHKLGAKLKAAFGHRLFAELMFVGDSIAWERPLKLASSLGLKGVITNDVHFPEKDDGAVHPILTKMKAGFDYDSGQLWLKSPAEIYKGAMRYDLPADEVLTMLKRSGNIARILGAVDLSSEPTLPRVAHGAEEFVKRMNRVGRIKSLIEMPVYHGRFLKEMDIINEMGFQDYFIILDDILANAREKGIKIGPGRGSGAGSLVLYLLGITDIDPIKFNLKFERFLNPRRVGMPDVDVDIESERREEVLEFAKEKFGAIPIATYSRYSHKSLTRDLGRMFRVEKGLIDKAADKGESSEEFAEIARENPGFAQSYEAFLGQIRHKGKHAGGVIITETPVPIERVGDGLAAAWTEGMKNELSYAGIVKFDLLGLSVLSALRRLEDETGLIPPRPVDFAPEFGLFRDGNLVGIFQFSGSDGIRDLTVEMQPQTFDDLIAINALYRPGAIDSGSTAKYPKWKKKPRKVPAYIEDVLKPTYGAIVYQEQVMEIFARTVGGTMADADLARALITKAKPDSLVWLEKMKNLKNDFIVGATSPDIGAGLLSTKEAKALWKELETHSNYSFNKSHSTAYAQIAWECAWWKFNYPAEFYAAMLNVDPAEEQTYIVDAVQAGIKIIAPHINKSTNEWVRTAHDEIAMPLSAVKFLGKSGVDTVLELRPEGGFESLEHLMTLVPKKQLRARARLGLYSLGGFRGMVEKMTMEEARGILQLKEIPVIKSSRDRQLKFLGFIIPDEKMLASFEKYLAKGWKCGIIKSLDMRESRWGPYAVYRLTPSGVFWSREVMDLKKGQVIAVQVSDKNGKALTIKLV